MTREELFQDGINSWRAVVASGANIEAKIKLFENAANELAAYVLRGCAKSTVVDALHEMAEGNGLIASVGEDAMQGKIARAFERLNGQRETDQADIERRWHEDDAKRARSNGNGTSQQTRFTLTPFESISMTTAANYLVKGVIPRTGLTIVWGRRNAASHSGPTTWRCTSRWVGNIAGTACNRVRWS